MKYILADFEFNQAFDFVNNTKGISNPACPFEIMQIGAIKLDRMLNMSDDLNLYIKPSIYKQPNPFILKLTGIDPALLMKAPAFPEAYRQFTEFAGKDAVFLFWGPDDMRELMRNIIYYKLDHKRLAMKYINLQKAASAYLRNSGAVGLRGVVEYFGIPIDRPFHNAINDAYYVGKILPLIYDESQFVIQHVDIEEIRFQKPKMPPVVLPKVRTLPKPQSVPKSKSQARHRPKPPYRTKFRHRHKPIKKAKKEQASNDEN